MRYNISSANEILVRNIVHIGKFMLIKDEHGQWGIKKGTGLTHPSPERVTLGVPDKEAGYFSRAHENSQKSRTVGSDVRGLYQSLSHTWG